MGGHELRETAGSEWGEGRGTSPRCAETRRRENPDGCAARATHNGGAPSKRAPGGSFRLRRPMGLSRSALLQSRPGTRTSDQAVTALARSQRVSQAQRAGRSRRSEAPRSRSVVAASPLSARNTRRAFTRARLLCCGARVSSRPPNRSDGACCRGPAGSLMQPTRRSRVRLMVVARDDVAVPAMPGPLERAPPAEGAPRPGTSLVARSTRERSRVRDQRSSLRSSPPLRPVLPGTAPRT